jgi:hypothetical protein
VKRWCFRTGRRSGSAALTSAASRPELLTVAQQATKRLEKILARSGQDVQVEWGVAQGDGGQPRVALRL